MLKTIPHSEQIFYVGADDKTLDLFESQYPGSRTASPITPMSSGTKRQPCWTP